MSPVGFTRFPAFLDFLVILGTRTEKNEIRLVRVIVQPFPDGRIELPHRQLEMQRRSETVVADHDCGPLIAEALDCFSPYLRHDDRLGPFENPNVRDSRNGAKGHVRTIRPRFERRSDGR